MRTFPQHWLRERFDFKLSAALCPEREARGEVRASNAGERESRAEAGGGQGYCDLGDPPGTRRCRPQGAQGGVGGPLGDARTRVRRSKAASSSCEILARPQRRGGKEARSRPARSCEYARRGLGGRAFSAQLPSLPCKTRRFVNCVFRPRFLSKSLGFTILLQPSGRSTAPPPQLQKCI